MAVRGRWNRSRGDGGAEDPWPGYRRDGTAPDDARGAHRYLPVLDGSTLMGVVSFYDVAKAVLEEQSYEKPHAQGLHPRLAGAGARRKLTPARSFAVIGAGVAGLACARALQAAGVAVTVFEREAYPSGRSATWIDAAGSYDHGAQYFTASDDGFVAELERWQSAGVVQRWPGRIVAFDMAACWTKRHRLNASLRCPVCAGLACTWRRASTSAVRRRLRACAASGPPGIWSARTTGRGFRTVRCSWPSRCRQNRLPICSMG